jgi:hypothetical protein
MNGFRLSQQKLWVPGMMLMEQRLLYGSPQSWGRVGVGLNLSEADNTCWWSRGGWYLLVGNQRSEARGDHFPEPAQC